MTGKDLQKLKLPDKPGVYFFLKGKEILYIGKATSLRDRVQSYMSKAVFDTRGLFIKKMLTEFNSIKYIKTDSVLEALILEASLIKKHQPRYNTKEKSDKSFNYVCITKEKLPRVIVMRGRNLLHFKKRKLFQVLGKNPQTVQKPSSFSICYGPYISGSQLREAMKIIRRIFPFLDEKSKNYLEFYKQINLVPDLNDRKLYLQNIRNIKLFFSGKKRQIFKNLKKEMNAYAKTRQFEKAGEIKRQIFALRYINDVALIKEDHFTKGIFFSGFPAPQRQPFKKVSLHSVRIEAYDIAHMGGKNMVGAMTVVENGEIAKSEYKKFKIRTKDNADDIGALREVLKRRLAHTEWQMPNLIVLDGGKAQLNMAKKVLTQAGVGIPVVSVLKDDRHKPKDILGDKNLALKYEKEILLANYEAHRFAIAYHKNMRGKNFLK